MNSLIQRVRRRALSEYNSRVHGSSVPFVHVRPDEITEESWVDAPIHPPDILEGSPRAAIFTCATSDDGGTTVGLWRCTAGRFKWTFQCDEVVRILEGEVRVIVDGQEHHLEKDSLAFFGVGTVSEWWVPNFVQKEFFHRHPSPVLGRVLG
ncbi:MAG: cupin domain-containing protein [Myxococcota bacterium]|jgi:uncharacterized protein|nr:cupin domain-containing protein [Myxococcota bacterium]